MNEKPNPFLNPKTNSSDALSPMNPLDSRMPKARAAKKPKRYIPRGERWGRPRNF